MKRASPLYRRRSRGLECWRWLNTVVSLFLFLVLCGQGYVLTYLLRTGQLPIPARTLEWIQEDLRVAGLRLEADNLRVSLNGVITLKNVAVFDEEAPESIASAEVLQLSFAFSRGLELEGVRVSGGHLFCPAVHSPSGEREEALSDIAGSLHHDEGRWYLGNLRTRLYSTQTQELGARYLGVRLSGELPVPEETPEMTPQESEDALALYYQVARQLCAMQERLEVFTDPRLDVALAPFGDAGGLRAEVAFWAKALDTGEGFRAAAPRLTTVLRWQRDGRVVQDEPFRGKLETAVWQDVFRSGPLYFSARLVPGLEGRLPSVQQVRFGAVSAEMPERGFDTLSGTLALPESERIDGTVTLTRGLHTARLDGHFAIDSQSGEARFEGLFDPRVLFGEQSFSSVPHVDTVQFEGRPSWRGQVRLGPDFALENLLVHVQAGRGTFCEARVEGLSLDAYADPDTIDLPHLYLHTDTWSLNASAYHDRETGEYRGLLQGSVDPLAIAQVMPSWWTGFWEPYEFGGALPRGDVDLRGNTKKPDSNTVFLGLGLKDFSFMGVRVDEAQARVWFANGFLNVFDLVATRPDGRVEGEVQLIYHHNQDESHRQHYLLKSTLPLPVVSRFVDEEVREVLAGFECEEPPELDVRATLFGPQTQRGDESFVLFNARTEAPVLWKGFEFDYIRVSGEHNPAELRLPSIEYGFAGGEGNARVLWTYHPGPDKVAVATELDGARAMEAVRKVPYFRLDERVEGALPQLPGEDGELEFSFDGEGLAGEVETFRGKGLVGIDGMEVRRVAFFSGLTEAVRERSDNAEGITFDQLHTSYQISGGSIHFPDITMRGDSARLRGSGTYQFEGSSLGFKAVVHPFGAVSTPVISQVFSLVGPLTKTFEIRLYGSTQEPVWRVKFDPFGVVRRKGFIPPPEFSGYVPPEAMEDSPVLSMPERPIEPLAPLQPSYPMFEPALDPWMPPAGEVTAETDGQNPSGS